MSYEKFLEKFITTLPTKESLFFLFPHISKMLCYGHASVQ